MQFCVSGWQMWSNLQNQIHPLIKKGGIRTAKDSLTWLTLMKEELDDEWTTRELFRFGASGLLTDIERQIYHYCTGRYASANELP